MSENIGNLTKKQQKDRIRERYKGVDPDMLEVIPAKKQADFYDDVPRRVAVYVRVSTDDPRQTSSYELQKNYYEDLVERHESWTLAEIYADEGISGTSLKHRDSFNRMIADCKAGKIDMIITKSVSRFARNIVDCISIVRELGALKPAVGVFFETENIFTLKGDSEMGLSFQATMAQEESHTKSNIMNASLEMRFSHGIVLTPVLLGYDHDENGELVINEEEAKTVRLIFFMYLYGYSTQEIAEELTELGCTTKKGNTRWTSSSVLQQLRNERHCGDVLTRKTYTESYLNHKSAKNRGERTQHRWRGHHEAIISPDDFVAVQHMLDNAKYGNKSFLPQLHVIPEGVLKGFVLVNARWSGFHPEDYYAASESVTENEDDPAENKKFHAESGDFDFRGYEVARAQFFEAGGNACMTFSGKGISFNTLCVRKLGKTEHVQLLIHPVKKLIAIRSALKQDKNSFRWSRTDQEGKLVPKSIAGTAFIGTLFELFGWNTEYKYRLSGIRKQNGKDVALIFDGRETEVFVPETAVLEKITNGENTSIDENTELLMPSTRKTIRAYPSDWAEGFGADYYVQTSKTQTILTGDGEEQSISAEPMAFATAPMQTTPPDVLRDRINEIIKEKKSIKEPANGTDGTDPECS